MESNKKYIIVPVNGFNQRRKYLSLLMESGKSKYLCQKVDNCAG